MDRQEFNALMQQKADESRAAMMSARPKIHPSQAVAYCDGLREQARLDAIQRERETRARFYKPGLTALRGHPWEDVQ